MMDSSGKGEQQSNAPIIARVGCLAFLNNQYIFYCEIREC